MPAAPSKREAQQSADRIRIFREYLAELARDQVLVLSPEQQSHLDQHLDAKLGRLASAYDVDVTASEKQLSLGMRIISALGGLALCAGVILFFLRFWGLLSTPSQVAILIAGPVLGIVAMHIVSRRERTLYFTALIGLVTFAAFVLNVTALGSIFNLAPTPNAFFAWSAFAFIMAYQYGLRLPLAAALVCALVFISAKIFEWTGAYWTQFPERPEDIIPIGLAFVAVPMIWRHDRFPEFPGVYRIIGLLAVFLSLWSLANSGSDSYLNLPHKTVEAIYQALAFSFSACTIWIGIQHRLNTIVNLGSVFFTVLLFNKFVDWWWNWMPKYLFFFIIGGISIFLLILFKKLRGQLRSAAA